MQGSLGSIDAGDAMQGSLGSIDAGDAGPSSRKD